jgi:hypothetical protein
MQPQDQLTEVYEPALPRLQAALADSPEASELSGPYLLDFSASAYFQSAVRLMTVGRQPRRCCPKWNPKEESRVEGLQGAQRKLSTRGQFLVSFRRDSFSRASRRLHRRLNPSGLASGPASDSEDGFLKNYLIKMDHRGHRPPPPLEERICDAFNVLPDEIRVAQPRVIVFFTGPEYNARLLATFPAAQFLPVRGFGIEMLAKISHPSLPEHSYRTYPPAILRIGAALHGVIERIALNASA